MARKGSSRPARLAWPANRPDCVPDHGDQPGSLVGGEPGIQPHGTVAVGPVAQIPTPADGVVGTVRSLAHGLDPPTPQLEHREGLVLRRLDQRGFGLGLEDGGTGDLFDLGLRQPSVAHGLVGDRERAELACGLECRDGRAHARPGGFGDVGGRGSVASAPPDIGRLDAPGGQEPSAGRKPLDLGEDLEQPGGVGTTEPLRLQPGERGPEAGGHVP